MNRHFCSVLLLGIGLAGFCRGADAKLDFAVSEVLSVSSPAEFECRIAGYPYADKARFRVQARHVMLKPGLPVDEAAEYLRERLKTADHIVLKQVQFRNYFRLTADVSIDGQDLGEELIAQRLAMPAPVPTAAAAPSQALRPAPAELRYRPPAAAPKTVPTQNRRGITLEELLATKVDLSQLNETTTLQDALTILSESVRPRVPFVVLWNDLETNAMVDKNMPIGAGGFGELPLKYALKLILHSVSKSANTRLHIAMEGGVVTIGTQKGLLVKSTVKSYSVNDLVSVPFDESTSNQRGYQR
jgi:hypothetical protein